MSLLGVVSVAVTAVSLSSHLKRKAPHSKATTLSVAEGAYTALIYKRKLTQERDKIYKKLAGNVYKLHIIYLGDRSTDELVLGSIKLQAVSSVCVDDKVVQ